MYRDARLYIQSIFGLLASSRVVFAPFGRQDLIRSRRANLVSRRSTPRCYGDDPSIDAGRDFRLVGRETKVTGTLAAKLFIHVKHGRVVARKWSAAITAVNVSKFPRLFQNGRSVDHTHRFVDLLIRKSCSHFLDNFSTKVTPRVSVSCDDTFCVVYHILPTVSLLVPSKNRSKPGSVLNNCDFLNNQHFFPSHLTLDMQSSACVSGGYFSLSGRLHLP